MGRWRVRLVSDTWRWDSDIHSNLGGRCLGDGGAGMERRVIVELILLHRCPFLQQRTLPTF